MSSLASRLADLGLAVSDPAELIEAGAALGLAVLALAAGWYAGRRLGPWIANWWVERLGGHAEGLGSRMGAIIRHGGAALLLAIIANAWPWNPLSASGLGLALASAAAILTRVVLRGLNMPRWAAWLMAVVVFSAILSHALGGLAGIEATLEAVGFDIGTRRISLMSVLTILVTIVALYAAVKLVNRIVGHSIREAHGFDATQKLLFEKLAAIVIIAIAFFLGVDLLGLDLTSFAVFSGALGLAVGFGLQKTVGNLIAGIILLMDRSIKPGDVIVVGESFGWVNKIGVRAVSVITRDGKEHLIPNENLMTQEVENWSYSDRNVRVHIPVGVSYECDLELAQQLMMRAAVESPRVLTEPQPAVWLIGFGEYALQHEIRVWISDPESGVNNVRGDVLYRLWRLFKEHGIAIPYPQREIRVKNWSTSQPPGP